MPGHLTLLGDTGRTMSFNKPLSDRVLPHTHETLDGASWYFDFLPIETSIRRKGFMMGDRGRMSCEMSYRKVRRR